MYTPRAILSRLFLQSALSFFSTVGQLVTVSCEISVQSPITRIDSQYRVRRPTQIGRIKHSASNNKENFEYGTF